MCHTVMSGDAYIQCLNELVIIDSGNDFALVRYHNNT